MQGNGKRKMDQNNVGLKHTYELNNIASKDIKKKITELSWELEIDNCLVHIILFCFVFMEKKIKVHLYRNKLQVD